jgi:hypothetical protein
VTAPAARPVATGSGIERVVNCAASVVLPKVWLASSVYAARGTEVHAYLERISNGTPAADSLLLVADEHRGAAEAVDLPPLAEDLRLSPEVAFAYNPVTDTARVLGQSLERDYSAITEDEWPLTIDIAGLAGGTGIVRDWKTGWSKLPRTGRNWQMRGAALAVARAFDLDQVDAQLIYLRENKAAWRDRAGFDAFELAGIAAELRAVHARAQADRAAYAAGAHVEPTEGSWCRYCPSWSSCPAKAALVRWALTGEGQPANKPIAATDIAAALERVRAGKKALEHVERAILATVSGDPMLVEVGEDGTETWLGKHPKEGNEKLDAAMAVEIAADVLSIPPEGRAKLAAEITSTTKTAIEAAAKKYAAKGQAAGAVRLITDAIRARGGATRPTSEAVGLYTIRPKALAAGGQ